jgi:hypothetical protein
LETGLNFSDSITVSENTLRKSAPHTNTATAEDFEKRKKYLKAYNGVDYTVWNLKETRLFCSATAQKSFGLKREDKSIMQALQA